MVENIKLDWNTSKSVNGNCSDFAVEDPSKFSKLVRGGVGYLKMGV